jgi:hypothetical protein
MPGLDGTGPQGAGPLTGRGMGFCRRDFPTRWYHPIHKTRSFQRIGYAGRGRGWMNRKSTPWISRWTSPTPQQEIADLNALADRLKTQLDAIQKRIEELNS